MDERSRRKNNISRQTMYVHGNTVRKTAEVPQRRPEYEQPRRRKHAIRKNRERIENMSLGYVLFLILLTGVIFAVSINYLKVQAEITNRMEHISELESSLSVLKSDNDAAYQRLTSSVDLDEIKRVAMEELGMVYASEDQVIMYEGEESEYVKQYEDIPEEETGISGYLK